MSETPKNNGEKSNKFRNLILAMLLSGVSAGVGVVNCSGDSSGDELVPMYDDRPHGAMMKRSDREKMDRSACLIKQDTLSGVLGCLIGSDEKEENEKPEKEFPKAPTKEPEKKERKKTPSRPDFGDSGEPMLG